MISSLGREELYFRHELSHQQIDDILLEKKCCEYPETKAQHLSKINAFLQVSELLEKEGIDFIPQKGPVLSYRLYGDPLYRVYNDLDFYIQADSIPKAAELLLKNGFQSPYYDLPEDKCHRRLLFKHVNELALWSPSLETGIELHWSMFNARLTDMQEHDRLVRENVTSIRFEGRDYTVLKEEFELLFLVLHGGMHGWYKLKWLVDIVVYLQNCQIDEEKFLFLTS